MNKNLQDAVGSIDQDTIAAISTSMGQAGIGIVRLTGNDCFALVEEIFEPASGRKYSHEDNRKLRFGWIKDGGQIIDEVLVSFMEGPHTYTAEDVVEINAHGGGLSVKRILALCLEKGVRLAEGGEFTRRAFLNGRMDLAQAEAVLDVIDAKTSLAHEQAVAQLSGSLSHEIADLKEVNLNLLSHIEYAINFMEDAQEDLPQEPMIEAADRLIARMDQLIASSRRGRIIREGIRTVIVGRPNVGKSSLLNALLRDNRAIVTDIPGTTRDSIEESYNLDGIQLRLIDTAGIRQTDDLIESIGVDKSRKLLKEADLALAVVDGSNEVTDEDEEILRDLGDRVSIFIMNKSDKPLHPTAETLRRKMKELFPDRPWLDLSALRQEGLDLLQDEIRRLFFEEEIVHSDEPVIANLRHRQLLVEARSDLVRAKEDLGAGYSLDAVEVFCRSAYRKLCEITGEAMEDDILDKIFRDFCIGK